MASGKKRKPTEADTLKAALDFIKPASREIGEAHQQHCVLFNNYALASDGVLTMGHPFPTSFVAAPHCHRLAKALGKCGKEITIEENDGRLTIRSSPFRANIASLPIEAITPRFPDAGVFQAADDRLINGLHVVAPWALENSERVFSASILLRNETMVASNGHVVVEFWHGCNVGADLVMPKVAATALLNVKRQLLGFSRSDNSITFGFDGGAWLKTQLYNEPWPEYQKLFRDDLTYRSVPEAFFTAVKAVAPFVEDTNAIALDPLGAHSHAHNDAGAHYELPGLVEKMIGYNPKYLLALEGIMQQIHFAEDRLYFIGENVRGAVMGYDKGR